MDAWQGGLRSTSPRVVPGKAAGKFSNNKASGSPAPGMSRSTSASGAPPGMDPPPRRSDRLDGEQSGYAMSALADLQRAYLAADDEAHSLFDRVNFYRGKGTLDKKDVLDKGLDINVPERPRFSLKESSFTRLSAVVTQLQATMDTLAELTAPEVPPFIIDPERLMMPILSATNSRFELDRAWNVIITRLARAHDKLSRCVQKAQGKEVPPSPASTTESVRERLRKNTSSPNSVFDILYKGVPSLSSQLNKETLEGLRRGETLRSHLLSPVPLRVAFPDRSPEVSPAEHYFDSEGGHIINTPYDPENAGSISQGNTRRV